MNNIKKESLYDKKIIYLLFIPIILLAKVVRYTLMKTILVDNGIGHSWITKILYDNLSFGIWQSDLVVNTRSNAITFFQRINILDLSTYSGWEIYISIIFNIILLIILLKVKPKLRFEQFIFICLSIVVLNIFDFCLSKEPVQMIYFLLIFMIQCNKKLSNKVKFTLSILVVVFSAMTLRNYYILIALFTLIGYVLCKTLILKKTKVKLRHIIEIILGIGIVFFVMMKLASILSPEDYNELISLRTRNRGDAATQIHNLINGKGLIIFTINYVINVLRLCIPLELIPLGVKYIPYVLYQVFMSFYLIKSIKNIRLSSGVKAVSLYLFIGFILGSATFEPDFGSWVRHEAIFFPIILFLNDSIKDKYITTKK